MNKCCVKCWKGREPTKRIEINPIMTLNEFIKLVTAGTLFTVTGGLLTLYIKEYYLTKYFETRKENKSIDVVFKKYKDPILLSAIELSSRLVEILTHYPTVYLTEEAMNLQSIPLITNTIEDSHFRKHKFYSTIYRLCTFFGWLELYRQEITFLNGSSNKTNKKLDKSLLNIRSVFADGQLNENENWIEWKDFLIFREEQRAIGESMIVCNQNSKSICGFGKFKVLLDEYVETGNNDWLNLAINFFINLNAKDDFRKERYFLLVLYFRDLLEILDKEQSLVSIAKIDKLLSDRKI